MPPCQPEVPVPHGSMHCHVNFPAAPVWNVNVVFACGATGTLRPSVAIVKVWETPVAGSRLYVVVAGATALGFPASSGWMDSGPVTPKAFAYCVEPAGRAVASSKLVIVMVTVVYAGTVKSDGMYAGP